MIELEHSRRPFVLLQVVNTTFPTIPKSALDQLDIVKLDAWLTRHNRKLAALDLLELTRMGIAAVILRMRVTTTLMKSQTWMKSVLVHIVV